MRKDVAFYSQGFKLAGHLYLPDGPTQGSKRPGVVIGLGYTGIKEHRAPDIAPWLTKAGYVVLAFDYRGFGASEGPRWRLIPTEQVEDIRSAIDFLIRQPEVDSAGIGLFGNSFGGANVIYAAALDQRAKCVVSAGPFADGERWLKRLRRFWEWKEFLKTLQEDRLTRALTGKSKYVHPLEIVLAPPDAVEAFDAAAAAFPERNCQLPLETGEAILTYKPEALVHLISPRPVLFFAMGNDTISVVDECLSMYEKAQQPKKLVVFDDALHFDMYRSPFFERMMQESVAWYQQYLA